MLKKNFKYKWKEFLDFHFHFKQEHIWFTLKSFPKVSALSSGWYSHLNQALNMNYEALLQDAAYNTHLYI